MDILEVSINNTIDNPEYFRQLFAEFERENNVRVDLQVYDWTTAWMEFMRISLYRYGPSISETGDTWMGSLASRNCLRPFSHEEVTSMGGGDAFLEEMWKSCHDFDSQSVVAIPWSLDTYLLYYRRDLLAKAGIDETTAFASPESLVATLDGLQNSGVEIPLAMATGGNSSTVLHNASSWVWDKGGDFISADGKRVLFTDPKTLKGLAQYFDLHRFIPRSARFLDDTNLDSAFINLGAALALANPPLLYQIRHRTMTMPLHLIDNVAVAVQPGVPFVGGSNLIIWGHVPVRQENAAVEFIRCATGRENQLRLFEKTGLIPARLDALNEVEKELIYAHLAQSLKSGRAFKHLRLWGLVEDNLTKALGKVWKTIFAESQPDIRQILLDTLAPLEVRLNSILSE